MKTLYVMKALPAITLAQIQKMHNVHIAMLLAPLNIKIINVGHSGFVHGENCGHV